MIIYWKLVKQMGVGVHARIHSARAVCVWGGGEAGVQEPPEKSQ